MDDPTVEVMAPSVPYKMIIVYLTTLPTWRAYNLTLHARLFQTAFSVFISDQNVNGKSKRNGNCIFLFPWESQGSHI